MKKLLFAALLLTGCSHITGAIPLTVANSDPAKGVWVFVESDNTSWTGIYRCFDPKTDDSKDHPSNDPQCFKASWGSR